MSGNQAGSKSYEDMEQVMAIEAFEKAMVLRAIRAHERMHGASTDISGRYKATNKQVRVNDNELDIVTYWDVTPRTVRFAKQYGE